MREVPEYRAARGVRHRLATVLAVAVAAKLAGAQGVTAIAEFAGRLSQRPERAGPSEILALNRGHWERQPAEAGRAASSCKQ
ncbi:MAG: transposase family protein [Gammaproteobacteria bacterium]|nr:transposase family protein [Gammaproteobacteria bacterium]